MPHEPHAKGIHFSAGPAFCNCDAYDLDDIRHNIRMFSLLVTQTWASLQRRRRRVSFRSHACRGGCTTVHVRLGRAPVLIRKKDFVQWCFDYRRFSKVTVKDTYPPRLIEECLNATLWFSKVDVNAAYWQIKVNPEDRDKTAFVTKQYGLFVFMAMGFDLCYQSRPTSIKLKYSSRLFRRCSYH